MNFIFVKIESKSTVYLNCVSDIDLSNDENFIRCGNIVEFSGDFNTSESEGKITFGNVVIDTAADYNEEEDNE